MSRLLSTASIIQMPVVAQILNINNTTTNSAVCIVIDAVDDDKDGNIQSTRSQSDPGLKEHMVAPNLGRSLSAAVAPKLERLPSEAEAPPKLGRTLSVAEAPPKLGRTLSVVEAPPKLGRTLSVVPDDNDNDDDDNADAVDDIMPI